MGIKSSKQKKTQHIHMMQNDLEKDKRAKDINDGTLPAIAEPLQSLPLENINKSFISKECNAYHQFPIVRFSPKKLSSKEMLQSHGNLDIRDDQSQNEKICEDTFTYQENFRQSNMLERCTIHIENVYTYWCEECKVPICDKCVDHLNHDIIDVQEAYERKITENKRAFNTISKWILPLNLSMKVRTQKDMGNYCTLLNESFGDMLEKSLGLKNLLDRFVSHDCANISRKLVNNTNSILSKQMMSTNMHYRKLQMFCDKYDQTANKPVKFLLFLSRKHFPKNVPKNVSKLDLTSFDEKSNKVAMVQILADFIIKENKMKHAPENIMHQLTLVSSFQMTDINRVCHINCVTPTQVWISDYKYNLILMEIIENKLSVAHRVGDDSWGLGVYTVSDTGDLIYIDRGSAIKKLSLDCRTNERLFTIKNDWRPRCIYYSHFKRDLLIGMWKEKRCRVVRYDISGQKIQNSENESPTLYKYPAYITENWNGDVIVADLDKHALVVTDQKGAYRFSYEGPQNGSQLDPRGVCTDGIGHILVSDWASSSVQIIDKDGVFLRTLLTVSNKNNPPYGLCYEETNHFLWVGYDNSSKVTVFKYLN
ncbi:uncharacterized protein LOC133193647 [Saccostrea echinata]|uniref:uncharacterized protein LOC133193647 n=1 Tax=Saccostrea echinata TaxID=191078 RepID=UPI002A7FC99D|nr:uncharacterized protein LOC133193647 [Saccostrea echinata]